MYLRAAVVGGWGKWQAVVIAFTVKDDGCVNQKAHARRSCFFEMPLDPLAHEEKFE